MQTSEEIKRISLLERDMSVVEAKLDRVIDDISGLRMEMVTQNDRISTLQRNTEERFLTIQRDMHTGFTNIYREMGLGFADLHKSISLQTKWLLTTIMAAATLISLVSPFVERLLR